MLQLVYGGVGMNGDRWWQVQEPHGDSLEVVGKIVEPAFNFVTTGEVQLSIEDLDKVRGFCDEVRRRFCREVTEYRYEQELIAAAMRRT